MRLLHFLVSKIHKMAIILQKSIIILIDDLLIRKTCIDDPHFHSLKKH